jgi:hypothetical protein
LLFYYRTGFTAVMVVTLRPLSYLCLLFCSVTTLVVVVLLRHGVYRSDGCYITPFVISVLVVAAPAADGRFFAALQRWW